MRLLSSALITISMAASLCAVQFSHLFDLPGEGVLSSVVDDGSGGLTAAGTLHTPPRHENTRVYSDPFTYLSERSEGTGAHLRLVHADASSRITLDTALPLPAFGRALSVVPIDGGYAVGAESSDGQLAVTAVDTQGNVRFMRLFGSALTERIARLVRLRDGGLLIVGSSMTTRSPADPVSTQGMGENDLFLVRLDRQGQPVWEKKFGTKADESAADAVECPDGSFVVLATTASKAARVPYLLRISENGSPIWRLPSTEAVTAAYDLLLRRDGTLLASFGKKEGALEHPYLLHFDLQRHVLGTRALATQQSQKLIALRERSDQTLFAVGSSTDPKNGETDALAIRLDNRFDTLWERRFGKRGYDAFYDAAILADGTLGIVGTATPTGSEKSKMWMLKLNSDGTVAVASPRASGLYDALKKAFTEELETGRIVIGKDLRIELVDPALYYPVGDAALSETQERFLHTFVPKLLTTLRPYSPQIDQLRINGHTSSEWGDLEPEEGYLNNMELSTKRAWGVLRYLYTHSQSKKHRSWLSALLRNHGTAYADVVTQRSDDGKRARKVDFSIVLKEG